MKKCPDFVITYPKKYKSYNFSRQECKKQGFSRIGGRACYFTRLFARLPKQQKQPLIIKHLQTYFEKVTKSGKNVERVAWVISVQFQHIHLLSFPRHNPIGHSKFGRIQQGIGHRNIHYYMYCSGLSMSARSHLLTKLIEETAGVP